MSVVILSLGSNIANKSENINAMQNALEKLSETKIISSPLYESEAVDVSEPQENYYNKIIRMETNKTPKSILEITKKIEKKLGRKNKGQKLARTADIDILLFDDEIINEKELVIPHPRMFFRRFAMEGVKSVAPDLTNPFTKKLFAYYDISKEILPQNIKIIG
ncbi:MAG: 2-amino-4-hydroxy-6-hydroxymethyldihydropteridine diphosphokinase [Chitinispirillales bacterium]|jgi:2-amino-4-hydroxy-6-hydroxymethyldihydropteridine diphosphokinase|nr:2-amino-4-hydroxy-6-hydroxymethyldihydropteridine diphosphokinase [Chitinispirillales bacterium]